MHTKDITIDGEPLDVILRHYYAIHTLIKEVKKLNGNFLEWDNERTYENYSRSCDVEVKIKNLTL